MLTHTYPTSGPKYRQPSGRHALVAFDPGRSKAGMAVAVDGKIVACFTLRKKPWQAAITSDYVRKVALANVRLFIESSNGHGSYVLVSELPSAWDNRRDAADNCRELEALVKGLGAAETYLPVQWKGAAPKRIVRVRMMEALGKDELAVMPPESEHDAWDAAGIALFALGRVGRGCTKTQETQ